MATIDENIFENFYSAALGTLLEAKESKKRFSQKKMYMPASTEFVKGIKTDLISDKENKIKDLSIINFLFSKKFMEYLKDRMTEYTCISTKLYTNRKLPVGGQNIDRYSIYQLADFCYSTINDPSLTEEKRNIGSKKALKELITFAAMHENQTGMKDLLSGFYHKDRGSSDPIGQITIPVVEETLDPKTGTVTRTTIEKKYPQELPEEKNKTAVKSNFEILKNFHEYCERLINNNDEIESIFDEIGELLKEEGSITSDENKLFDKFRTSSFGRKFIDRSTASTNQTAKSFLDIDSSDIGFHINQLKLYDYLYQIGITPAKLKECLAFNKIIIDRYTSNLQKHTDEENLFSYNTNNAPDFDEFNPTDLTKTAMTSQLPDLTHNNLAIQDMLKNGKNTLDSLFGLNNIFSNSYDSISSDLRNGGMTNPERSRYIGTKYSQLRYLAAIENDTISSLVDLYVKIAKMFLFMRDNGLRDETKNDLIDITSDNSGTRLSNLKTEITKKFESLQKELENILSNQSVIWHDVFDRCQIMAYNETKTDRGMTVFPAYTKNGAILNLTIPTNDLLKTIDDERIRLSFYALDNNKNAQSIIDLTKDSFILPISNTGDIQTKINNIIKHLENNSAKNIGKSVEIKLQVTDETINKFLSDTKGKVKYEEIASNSLGNFINNNLNSNVKIIFEKTAQATYDNPEDLLKQTTVRVVSYKYRKSTGKTIEIKTPLYAIDAFHIINASMKYAMEKTRSGYSLLNYGLQNHLSELIKDLDANNNDSYSDLLKRTIKTALTLIRKQIFEDNPSNYKESEKNIIKNASSDNHEEYKDGDLSKLEISKDMQSYAAAKLFGENDNKIIQFSEYAKNIVTVNLNAFDDSKDFEFNAKIVIDDISDLFPIILFDFVLFNLSQYESLTDVKSKNPSGTNKITTDEIDEIFKSLYETTKNNFQNIVNNSSIRSLDDFNGSVLAASKEFGRVVNNIMRGSARRSLVFQRTSTFFNAIEPIKGSLSSFKDEVSKAFQKILDYRPAVYQTPPQAETDLTVDMQPSAFEIYLDYKADAEKMSSKYCRFANYLHVTSEFGKIDYDGLFTNLSETTGILKDLYKNTVNGKNSFSTEYILALKNIVLYYYFLCCLIYFIMERNANRGFDDGDLKVSKIRTAKIENDINDEDESEKKNSFMRMPNRGFKPSNAINLGKYYKKKPTTPKPSAAPTAPPIQPKPLAEPKPPVEPKSEEQEEEDELPM